MARLGRNIDYAGIHIYAGPINQPPGTLLFVRFAAVL